MEQPQQPIVRPQVRRNIDWKDPEAVKAYKREYMRNYMREYTNTRKYNYTPRAQLSPEELERQRELGRLKYRQKKLAQWHAQQQAQAQQQARIPGEEPHPA